MTRNLNIPVILKPSLKKISNKEIVIYWYGEDDTVREFLVELIFEPSLENLPMNFKDGEIIFIIESEYHRERAMKSHSVRRRYGDRFFSAYLSIYGVTFTSKVNPAMVGGGFVYPKRYSD